MMSKKQWFVLFCLFVFYLLLGASIFFYVESYEEIKNSIADLEDKQIIEGECSTTINCEDFLSFHKQII